MGERAALISIKPGYAEKIITGEKRLEFRRSWAVLPVDILVIYSSYPKQRVVAIANIENVVVGSKTTLWNLAKEKGGGISRRKLFDYLDGKKHAVAIELSKVHSFAEELDPTSLFGADFRPPQSFRYLKDEEYQLLEKLIGK